MAAYVIIDIEVRDWAQFQEYQRLVGPIFDHYGGKFLAQAGQSQVLEGDWIPHAKGAIALIEPSNGCEEPYGR